MSMRKTFVAAAVAASAVLGTAGTASATGSGAVGGASGSPGVLSGNVIQVPLGIPLNLCGTNLSLLAALTGTSGNTCANG